MQVARIHHRGIGSWLSLLMGETEPITYSNLRLLPVLLLINGICGFMERLCKDSVISLDVGEED